MNICVTGALGHIGSALIRAIHVNTGDKVVLVDNLSTQRYASLFDLPKDIDYEFRPVDILSDDMDDIIKSCGRLIHLAAVTDAESSFEKKDHLDKVNREGLEHVAGLCARHHCSLLFPSSTSVYGVQEGLVDENCSESDLKPQSPYADSKLFGENLLKRLAKQDGLKFIVFRVGTIFGYSVGMRFHTAVNKFVWQACLGEPISVWKTALKQKRAYCDLKDCVNAVNYVLAEDLFNSEIYNVLTDNFTVEDIVTTIKQYVPDLNIEFVDSPIMNQLSYEVSTAKSRERGFSYQGNLSESLQETINKLKNVHSQSVSTKNEK